VLLLEAGHHQVARLGGGELGDLQELLFLSYFNTRIRKGMRSPLLSAPLTAVVFSTVGVLIGLLVEGVARGAIRSAHDVADGGLAVALAECCFTGGAEIGARVTLAEAIRPDALLFGEAPGRVLVATADADALLALAAATAVPARRIGETGGERLCIASPSGRAWIDAPVAKLRALWENGIPRRLEVA